MELVMENVGALLKPYSPELELLMMLLCYVKLLRSLRVVFPLRKRGIWESSSVKSLLGGLIQSSLGLRLSQLTEDPVMWHFSIASLVLNALVLLIIYRNGTIEHKINIAGWIWLVILIVSYSLLCSIFLNDPADVKYFLSLARTGTTVVLIIMGLFWGSGSWLGHIMSLSLTTSKLLYALSIFNRVMSYQCIFVLYLVLLRITYQLLLGRSGEEEQVSRRHTRLHSARQRLRRH